MKKILVMLLMVFGLMQQVFGNCLTPGADEMQKQSSKTKFNADEQKIAMEIKNITQVIENEIKSLENQNTQLMNNIRELQKAQTLSEKEKSFLLKKQNEIQSIVNSVNAEIGSE